MAAKQDRSLRRGLLVAAFGIMGVVLCAQSAEAHTWWNSNFYTYLGSSISPGTTRPGRSITQTVTWTQRGLTACGCYGSWNTLAGYRGSTRLWTAGPYFSSAWQTRTINVSFSAPSGSGTHEIHAYIVGYSSRYPSPSEYNGYAGATVTVDGTPPPPPNIAIPTEGEVVRSTGVTIQGTAEARSTVRIRENGSIIQTASTGTNGVWLTSVQFGGGTHSINATAVDIAGNESSSSALRTFEVRPEADPPRNVYATAGNALGKVTWDAPINPGNSPIVSYKVTSTPDLITTTVGPTARKATLTGLTNNRQYRFIVTAVNGNGVSAASVPSNPIVPFDPTNPPPPPSDPHAPIRHNYGGSTPGPYGGEPVNLATGNLSYERQDLDVPVYGPPLGFSRAYNSREPVDGPLGSGWTHSYSEKLLVRPDRVVFVHADGRQDTFLRTEEGLTAGADVLDVLQEDPAGGFTHVDARSKLTRSFDAAGRLLSITDRGGNELTVSRGPFDTFSDYTFNRKIIERVESAEEWTVSRGTIDEEHVLIREGQGSLRLTDASAFRPGLDLDLWEFADRSVSSPDDHISAWVYIEDADALRASDALTLTLHTTADAYLKTTWDRSHLSTGWNRIDEQRSEFEVVGETPDWASITGIGFEVWPEPGLSASVVLDDVRLARHDAATGAPFELGPTYTATGVWEHGDGAVSVRPAGDALLLDQSAVVRDGTLEADVMYELLDASSAHPAIVARHGADGHYVLSMEPTRLVLARADAEGVTELAATDGVFEEGLTYRLRFTLDGSELRSAYSLEGEAFIDGPAADDAVFAEGGIGLAATGEGRSTFDDFGFRSYRVTAANGQVLKLTRSSDGRVARLDAPGDRTMSFAYDERGNLVEIVDFAGGVSRFDYDDDHQMLEMRSPEGRRMLANTYDAEGRVVAQRDGLGNELTIAYDTENRETTLTDARGNATTYTYDENFRLVSETDAAGGRVQYGYDPTSQFSEIVDKRGKRLTFDYAGAKLNSVADQTATYDFTYDGDDLTQMRDALGRVTTYEYDDAGRPVAVIDPVGNVTRFAYDAHGSLTELTDPLGARTMYAYDALGRLVSTTDALGETTTLGYDDAGNVTSVTDALGATTTYEYDALSRPVKTTDAEDAVVVMTYDGDGNLTAVVDANGNPTTLTYDAQSNLIEVARAVVGGGTPAVLSTRYAYDPVGNRTQVIDPAGNVTRFTYDALDRLIETITPTGARYASRFDENGNEVATVDPLGNETEYGYDDANRLISMTDPTGETTTCTYDANGNLEAISDAAGGVTRLEWDPLGRVIEVTDAEGAATQIAYDAAGRQAAQVDPLGNRWEYSYDALGALTSESDPLGNVTSYARDAVGNVVGVTDAKGARTRLAYDAVGRLTGIIDALDAETGYEYDANGNRIATTDALGRVSRAHFDELDRLTGITDALNGRTRYDYDAVGNLVAVADAAGNTTRFEYDADGRRTAVVDALGRRRSIAYDAAGRVISEQNARGSDTGYSYDERGDLVHIDQPDSPDVSYGYDALGRRISMTDAAGETSYAYDAVGRLTRVVTGREGTDVAYSYDAAGRVTGLTGAVAGRPYDADYSYDAAGRLTALSALEASAAYSYDAVGNILEVAYGNGTSRRMRYDALDRVTEIRNVGLAGADLASALEQTYAYDAVGNTVRRQTGDEPVERFGYDGLNRLTRWSHGDLPGLVETYAYDAAGNRVRQASPSGVTVATYSAANELLTEIGISGDALATERKGITAHTYDADGNRIGTVSPGGAISYTFDAAGRMTGASTQNGSIEFAYDGDGDRLSAVGPTEATEYAHVGGALLGTSGVLATSYAWGGGQLAFGVSDAGAPSYVHPDSGGSIVMTSDAQGSIGAQARFDPFGNKLMGTERGSMEFGFVGGEGVLDETATLGTYQMGRRAYDPRSGTFLSADPVIGSPGIPQGFNRYAYAFNNPFTFNDATGGWPSWNDFKNGVRNKAQQTWNTVSSGARQVAEVVKRGVDRTVNAVTTATQWVVKQVKEKVIPAVVKAAQVVKQAVKKAWDTVTTPFKPPAKKPVWSPVYETKDKTKLTFNPNTGSWEDETYQETVLRGYSQSYISQSCGELPSWYLYSCQSLGENFSAELSYDVCGKVFIIGGCGSIGIKASASGVPLALTVSRSRALESPPELVSWSIGPKVSISNCSTTNTSGHNSQTSVGVGFLAGSAGVIGNNQEGACGLYLSAGPSLGVIIETSDTAEFPSSGPRSSW